MGPGIQAQAIEALAESTGARQLILVSWDGEQLTARSWGASTEDASLASVALTHFTRTLGWPHSFLEETARRELDNLKCDHAAAVAALVAAPAPIHLAKLNAMGVTLTRYTEWFEGPRRRALIAAGVLSRPQEGGGA